MFHFYIMNNALAEQCRAEKIQSRAMSDLGDAIWQRKGRWGGGQRDEWGVWGRKKRGKEKRSHKKRQGSRSQKDGWGERIWMREQWRGFCSRWLRRGSSQNPCDSKSPPMAPCKLRLLIWGLEGGSCTVGRDCWTVYELSKRTKQLLLLSGTMWSHSLPSHGSSLHAVLNLTFENLLAKVENILFDSMCQAKFINVIWKCQDCPRLDYASTLLLKNTERHDKE